ncbi:VOC family protein [Aspergillus saccharolyticus JOP 1030-1]|uniref:VOC domain-containing protein n=1 Tax=Aspergillus saccharolyticus JOP 1030-1 TaxID=1450539 RepID=A0A318ZBZ1_9EURO|nr:hypothetical protein BP01DRAFT_297625 [Aspergillus saccharolyticus JOP 1030-1]PYH44991.1 hypothetical protein BP01DRAFT_297625 [Aspergillus saccharolyticus JOP 1030-1]
MPLSHLTLTVSHLPTSTSFFLSCLQPLGYQFIGRHDDYIGFGQKQGEPADFWITEQKPGVPAGAAHVAFPATSKDAVGDFFISALKAGGKIHGEPKMRDSESGYYSAAVIDFDGNSIEAVYRPSSSSARSEVNRPALALLENGSVVSKASSRASSVKTESIAPPRSEARSEARSYISKTNTTIERAAPAFERGAPSMVSRDPYQAPRNIQPAPSPTYIVHHTTHTTQKTDNDKTAKTIVGTLIGAAAGAALAYAIAKGDSTEATESSNSAPPQFSPRDLAQLISPSQASSPTQEYPGFKAIEAGPARSTYTARSDGRPMLTRSVTSKNPRASTIYEGTEFVPRGNGGSVYMDENGRRASEGSVYSTRELPLRAIEYGQPDSQSRGYESTLISSFPDKSRAMDRESVYSASTIKPSKGNYQESHHGSHRSSHSHQSTPRTLPPGSTAPSTRSVRQVPIPEGSAIGSLASYRSGVKSGVSAREVPLPESVIDLDVRSNVTPDDSISQVDDSRRSSYSHRSHASKAAGSRVSKHSSKFDEPVKPSDSVSQVSSNVSQRTMKAGGGGGSIAPSKAASKISSRRGSSQVA